MGLFDEERKQLGIMPKTNTTTSVKPKAIKSIFADERESIVKPVSAAEIKQEKLTTQYKAETANKNQFANPDIMQSQTMQKITSTPNVEPTWNGVIDNPIVRGAGNVLKTVGKVYDKVSHLPVINQATGAMQGAIEPFVHNDDAASNEPIWKKYLGNVKDVVNLTQKITNPASIVTGNLIPSGKDTNLIEKGKAVLQAPGSMIKGAFNPDEARKNLEDSLKSKSLVTKFAVDSLADPLSYVPIPSIKGIKTASGAVSEAFEKFAARNKEVPASFEHYQQAAKSRNELSLGEIDRGEQGIVDRFNFMEKQTNKGQPLQLNPSRAEVRQNAARDRSILEPNTKPIQGRGETITLGLPESNTPRIISDIKKQANAIIKPPTSRRDLLAYTEQHLEIPRTELVEMTDKDLYQLGQMIRSTTNKDVLYAKLAAEQGHNWTELVSGKSVTGNVEAPLNRIQDVRPAAKPSLIGSKQGESVALEKTKAKLSDLKKVDTLKPKVEPINVNITKKEAVKTTTEKPAELKSKAVVKPAEQTPGIRANYRNQLKNGNLSPELQTRIKTSDQSYEKITNKTSDDVAKEAVKNLSKAESDFLLNQSGGADHIATGYRLQQKLDALGLTERALIVSHKLAKDLTKGGQTTQAGSIISRLSPEGQLLNLTRTAIRNNKTVSVADSVEFKAQAKIVKDKAGAGVRANQFTEILDRAAKGEKLTSDDIQKMSDYLSSAEKSVKPKVIKVVDDLPEELKVPRKRDRIVSYLDEVEKEALARIAARKGKVSAMVLPNIAEWADHSIVVASQIAKGSIKAATHTEDLVKLFGEEIRPVATQVFQKAQSLVKSISPGVGSNDITKANEAFKRISGQAKEVNLQEKVVEKYLKENPKVSPKDIDTLRDLAKSITKLSNDSKIDADIQMQKILNSYEKSSAWDKVTAIRYMAMLLNTGTQLVNAASGPLMATTGHVADVFGTMVDIAMHTALKTPRTTTLYGTNPIKFIARYFKNLKVGGKAGFQGVNPAGIQGTNEIRGLAFPGRYNPLGWGERTLGAVAKGADYATYKSVYDSEMVKQGFLDAINSGIKRSDKAAIKSHVENFINDPTEAAMLNADRIGKNTTFQRSDSIGGQTANALNSFKGKVGSFVKPVVNVVVPFVRTPINIASTAVTLTPAGIIKGLFQLTSKSQATQREAIRSLSLGLTGSAGIGTLGYYLSQLGIITGANDSGDKDVDAIREQAGLGKYRFNQSALKRYMNALLDGEGSEAAEKAAKYQEGDKAFDYNKFQPLAFPLAIGASLGKTKGKPTLGRMETAGADAYGSLFGMSTLKSVQSIFQPTYGGTTGEKALGPLKRVQEAFLKSFSWGGLAQEARRQDPIIRKTPFNDGVIENTKAYFKSRIPGMSQSLPASKTTLGMDKMNAPGFMGSYVNPYRSEVAAYTIAAVTISELIDRTGDFSVAPSAPEKKVSVKNKLGEKVSVAIPQDRYEQLQEEIGHNIIVKIMALDPNLSDLKKVEKIKGIYESVRNKEMDKVAKELKSLAN